MEFTCIGFDIRVLPCEEYFSADWSEWERSDAWYQRFLSDWKLTENFYGLLDIQTPTELSRISTFVLDNLPSCDLVAISLPSDIVRFYESKFGYLPSSFVPDLSNFACLGLDICDLQGFWSILNHPLVAPCREVIGLIPEFKMELALEAVQLANVVERSHQPCAVTKLHALKARISGSAATP